MFSSTASECSESFAGVIVKPNGLTNTNASSENHLLSRVMHTSVGAPTSSACNVDTLTATQILPTVELRLFGLALLLGERDFIKHPSPHVANVVAYRSIGH